MHLILPKLSPAKNKSLFGVFGTFITGILLVPCLSMHLLTRRTQRSTEVTKKIYGMLSIFEIKFPFVCSVVLRVLRVQILNEKD